MAPKQMEMNERKLTTMYSSKVSLVVATWSFMTCCIIMEGHENVGCSGDRSGAPKVRIVIVGCFGSSTILKPMKTPFKAAASIALSIAALIVAAFARSFATIKLVTLILEPVVTESVISETLTESPHVRSKCSLYIVCAFASNA